MSSSDNNITYKKTSFLAGINSEFINQFYADYISDPNSLPDSWRKFFDGLSDNEKLIYDDIKGPSWSPQKKINKIKNITIECETDNWEKLSGKKKSNSALNTVNHSLYASVVGRKGTVLHQNPRKHSSLD